MGRQATERGEKRSKLREWIELKLNHFETRAMWMDECMLIWKMTYLR
jgi:hypothetical protein